MNRPECDDHWHVIDAYSPPPVDGTWCRCLDVIRSGDHTDCDCHPDGLMSVSESEGTKHD